ncbi:MAG: metallophosphoesterase [Nitrospirota bacterium]|nr:metallophosphoesterase [Nitrospirota bacterium]
MGKRFVILHLSDAHIGHPDHFPDVNSVLDPLLTDLNRAFNHDKLLPSLIVFSGDLVYGDIPEKPIKKQFDDAKTFIEKVHGCFNKSLGDIPLLLVPGNHDINRNSVGEDQKLYRDKFTSEIVEKLMQKKEATWKRIIERQKEWLSFVQQLPNQPWQIDENLLLTTGKIAHNDKFNIGIVGLNSSWASHEQGEQGRLWVGEFQYKKAYEAIKDCDLKIAVAHHPLDWLHQDEKNLLTQKIESQFNIYLHGHEHSQWFTDSRKHLKCAAGTCYADSKDRNGYSWLEIDFETSDSQIRLREYTNQGAGDWRSNYIPDKTDENGIAKLTFLRDLTATVVPTTQKEKPVCKDLPHHLVGFLKILEDQYFLRWERGSLPTALNGVSIYWPVRLRHPTPIHAVQCFVAAGLQKLGCHIYLWIDDLGTQEYQCHVFIEKLLEWYKKAGGNESHITVKQFNDILEGAGRNIEPAWQMLQKWLGNSFYMTDQILRISKILPTADDYTHDMPQNVLDEIKKRRPRRLMTPSMVWTCLSVLHQEQKEGTQQIITLSGYDERELWDAWQKCCSPPSMKVGHLYVSKLMRRTSQGETTLHMADNHLNWTSKEDIESNFEKAYCDDDGHIWDNPRNMIAWAVNNCVLLPNYIAQNHDDFQINGLSIRKLDDLKTYRPIDIREELVSAVNRWLF